MARTKSMRAWRAVLVGPALVLAAASATLVRDRETGILAVVDLIDQVGQVEARVDALKGERAKLIGHVRGLRSDPFEIESVARGKLGMVRPGELVVQLGSDGAQLE